MLLKRFGFFLTLLSIMLFISATEKKIASTSVDKSGKVQLDEGAKRNALWNALMEACPEAYRKIEVYAENPDLTQVCFRSKNVTLIFDINTRKVEVQQFAKGLPPINRITYRENNSGGVFILWYDGQQELSIAVGK